MLAPDLLHAARALRVPDDRRQGAQAQGGADRAARNAGRRALHSLLPLRPLLRHDHEDGRARDLQPRRPLGARPVPGDRRSTTPTPATWWTSARWAPSPTGTSASRRACGTWTAPSRSARDAPAGCNIEVHTNTAARPPRPGPPGRPAQAALQRRREPVVDVRRGPVRVRRDRRADPARAAGAPRRRGAALARLGRGRGRARRGRPRRPGPRGPACCSRPRMANEDLWLARRLFVDTLGVRLRGLPGAARPARLGRRPAPGGRQGAEHARAPSSWAWARRGRATRGPSSRPPQPAGSGCSGSSITTSSTGGWPAADGGGGARAGRGARLPGPDRQRDQRARPRGPAERGLRRARRHVDERPGPGPAVLARGGAAGRGAGRLGDPGGGARARSATSWRPLRAEHLFRELAAAVPAFARAELSQPRRPRRAHRAGRRPRRHRPKAVRK